MDPAILADIARARDDPGYTPSARAVPRLIDALADLALDDETARAVERALVRTGAVAARHARVALDGAPERFRSRLLGLLARLSASVPAPELFESLAAALADASPRCRRLALRGLGNSADPRAEDVLLESLPEQAALDVLRALVDALGKVGTARAASALERLESTDDELARRVDRARLLIARRLQRETPSAIRLDRPLPGPATIALSCRRGLAELLAAELASAFAPRITSATRVEVEHAGPLGALLVADKVH